MSYKDMQWNWDMEYHICCLLPRMDFNFGFCKKDIPIFQVAKHRFV